MGYEEFKIMLLERLQEKMGSSVEVKFEMLQKNNGTEVEAVILSDGDPVMPAPHVKGLYELYREQGEGGGFDACISMIWQLYASKDTIPVDKVFKPWDEVGDGVKDKIMPVLINKKWNEEILRDAVYKEFLDFAIILWVPVFEMPEGNGIVRVNKKILDLWGVSESELWEVAFRNLKNEKFVIQDLVKAVSEVLRGSSVEGRDILPDSHEPEKEEFAEETGLEQKTVKSGEDARMEGGEVFQYLMTNRMRNHGAVGMLRTDLLQKMTEKEGCSLFILPSSIHETILVPDRGMFSAEMLRETVESINREQVEKWERLSDNVYYFRKGGSKVEIL